MDNLIVQGTSIDELIKRITSNVVGEIKPLLTREEKENKRLSRREAADWLGISDRTLDVLSKGGSIKFSRVGGRVMYQESDLQQYLDKNKSR